MPEQPGSGGATKGSAVTAPGSAALEVALAWYHARNDHDIEKDMSTVADNIVCDAPGVHLEGSKAFRDFEDSSR